jgi:hypothetical protein
MPHTHRSSGAECVDGMIRHGGRSERRQRRQPASSGSPGSHPASKKTLRSRHPESTSQIRHASTGSM